MSSPGHRGPRSPRPHEPSLSIIIPFKNAGATLGEMTASLGPQMQALRDLEGIGVDDGSRDDGSRILADAGFRILNNAPERGPAAARNKGARSAKGEVLLFLDADVVPEPGLLSQVLSRFREDEALEALSGVYHIEPANTGFFPRYKALRCHDWFRDVERFGSLETACAAVRRETFLRSGGFDESFTGADVEDYELGYRLGGAEGIPVDHEMRVRHHFSGGLQEWEKLAKRSYQWAQLSRPRFFDTAAATPREAAASLAGAAGLALLMTALALGASYAGLTALLLLAAQLVLRAPFYRLCHEREGPPFTLRAVLATLIGDAVVVPSATLGYLVKILKRS